MNKHPALAALVGNRALDLLRERRQLVKELMASSDNYEKALTRHYIQNIDIELKGIRMGVL